MTIGLILALAAALLVGLVKAEKTEHPRRILVFKAPLSLLFIVAWTLGAAQHESYAGLVLIALLFCLGGDVLLALGSKKTFLFGLASFLLGHIMYAVAFFMAGHVGPSMAMGMLLLMLSAVFIWRWLEPHLKDMTVPVLAYIVVISIMVCGAFGMVGGPTLPSLPRACVFTGAILFYLSDLFVARQRFVTNAHINRVVGLPLYYAAQFLLAFSAAWIPG
jgi:uncharacterized membrane protein YhhN